MRSRLSSRQSKTFLVQRRIRLWIHIGITVVAIVFTIALTSVLSSWSLFTITHIEISGVATEDVTSVHDIASQSLSGSYLNLFSRNNTFLYPRAAIRDAVQALHPEAESVDVSRTDRHTVVVTLREKVPAALVCASLPDFDGNEVSLGDSGDCYFTDSSGVIYKKAPAFTGVVYDRYYMPDLASENGGATSTALIGLFATSSIEFATIRQVYAAVEEHNIIVDAMLMKGGGEYELYVRNPDMSSSTAVIYFNTISPVAEQISNLISFWDHTVATARTKHQRVQFDYIDVRYSPNVYHRFAH